MVEGLISNRAGNRPAIARYLSGGWIEIHSHQVLLVARVVKVPGS